MGEMDHIRETLSKQDAWLRQLHMYSHNLFQYANDIKHSNVRHKRELLDQIKQLSDWADAFHTNHLELKKDVNELRHTLTRRLRNDFSTYHNMLMEYVDTKYDQPDMEALKQEIKEEIREEMRHEMMRNLQKNVMTNAPAVKEQSEEYKPEFNTQTNLSNPEKELLNMLFNENKPLTYEAIAEKLDKSVSSIRVYMNSLRSKRDVIEEFSAPGGKKIFSIKNSELVKTLFNL